MATPFVGEIRLVGFNFAPVGWAFCDGSLLSIAENDTLFNLIGTTYGGDGEVTFALPDLRSRVPVHTGSNGNSTYVIGETFGVETVSLGPSEIPSHTHSYVLQGSEGEPTSDRPDGAYPAEGGYYASSPDSVAPFGSSTPLTTTPAGGGQPHSNLQPYLALNFIISLFGVFPSQS